MQVRYEIGRIMMFDCLPARTLTSFKVQLQDWISELHNHPLTAANLGPWHTHSTVFLLMNRDILSNCMAECKLPAKDMRNPCKYFNF